MRTTSQFYPTPPAAVQIVAKAARLKRGHRVLEPSCGDGALVQPALAAGCKVLAIDIRPSMIWFDIHKLPAKAGALTVWLADYLCINFPPERRFDRVLMNPPFNPDLDVRHVLHAWDFSVAEGGEIHAIITPRYRTAKGWPHARLANLISCHGQVTPLPDNPAKGATRKTVLVSLLKPKY